jgi:uncharacterized protein (TIGR02172 family)
MIQPLENIRLGKRIAHGLTSEIYELDAERVVKLYLPWMGREKAEWEFSVTKALHAAGLPVPKPFEIIETDQRFGLVLERLHGISMMREVAKKPWRMIAGTRQAAQIQAQLHACRAPAELRTQRTQIEQWIAHAKDLPPAHRSAARDALAKIQDGAAICHGDFHPENIFLTPKGPIIIDWSGGTRGDPIGDLARTASLIRHAEIPDDWPFFIRAFICVSRGFLLRVYLRAYFEIRPGRADELALWEPIQKAAMSAWRARMESGF